MKSKIFIACILVALALGFMVFLADARNDDDHDTHDHAERSQTTELHDDQEDHDDSSEHEEDLHQAIELTAEQIQQIGLETAVAAGGTIDTFITLQGQIKVNQDRLARIVPRVEGIVTEVKTSLGDTVKQGQTLALIKSMDLADAKAQYLATVEKFQMARLSFEREDKLFKEQISSEEEYLDKKQALTEAGIEKRTAEQKLIAIGFDQPYLDKLPDEPQTILTRFEIKAPFEGTVIEKHIVLGESVNTDSAVYTIADLSSVWVDLQAYPKDLIYIRKDQQVTISAGSEIPHASSLISYVGPIVNTDSRTALVRILLANSSALYRPGLFVTAQVAASKTHAKIVVPKIAVQSLEGNKCVFVKDDHGFEPAFVETGRENKTNVEILSGLTPGQEYVTTGAFALKSKIITSTLDSHAGHGH